MNEENNTNEEAPDELDLTCAKCGAHVGEPDVAMCDGCKDTFLCKCGGELVDPGDNMCPGCQEVEDDERPSEDDDERPSEDD